MSIGGLLRACGWSPVDRADVLAPVERHRFIKVRVEKAEDGSAVFRYTLDAVTPAAARRLGYLLKGDRRQQKRALRIMRQQSLIDRPRQANVIIGDETDAFGEERS